ncbi:MAG: hypothetical protein ACREKL_03215 [Chthoniobacterales bacterium]
MKTRRLFIASIVPAIALVGGIGYELGVRSTQPNARQITSGAPVVPSREAKTATLEISAPVASPAVPISAKPAPLSPHSDFAESSAPGLPAAAAATSSPSISPGIAAAPLAITATNRAPAATKKPVEFSDGETLVTQMDPALPGNSFRSRGMRVAVAETTSSLSGDSRPSLGLDVTPETSNEAAGSNFQTAFTNNGNPTKTPKINHTESNQAAKNDASNTQNPPALSSDDSEVRDRWGLTAEEEQFRTKWGWAALDAARTAAKEQAGK